MFPLKLDLISEVDLEIETAVPNVPALKDAPAADVDISLFPTEVSSNLFATTIFAPLSTMAVDAVLVSLYISLQVVRLLQPMAVDAVLVSL
jgi:hypothetical protein